MEGGEEERACEGKEGGLFLKVQFSCSLSSLLKKMKEEDVRKIYMSHTHYI